MPSDTTRIIEQAKFTYSLLGKASEKQNWSCKNKTSWSFKNCKTRKSGTRINWTTFSKKDET